jgi:hypothetical protein
MSTSSTRPSSDGGGDVYLTKTGANVNAESVFVYNNENFRNFYDNILVDDVSIGNDPNP